MSTALSMSGGSPSSSRAPPPAVLRLLVAAVAGGLVVLVLVFGSFYTVDAGEQAVVTRLGAVSRIEGPGAHLKLPLIEGVTKISTRTQTLDFAFHGDKADTRMEAYSHDQQPAMMSVKVVFHVKGDPASVTALYSQFRNSDGFASAVLVPRASQAVKTTFGQFTAVTVIQERARFNQAAEAAVRALVDAAGALPVVLDGVQIYDLKFSQVYEHAVEQRMQAQVEVEKAAQVLERSRKEAEIQIVQAEAAAKSTRLRGEAEAAAIRLRSDALRDSPKLVELTIAEKWDGKLPTTMVPGGGTPLLHLEPAAAAKR